MQGMDTYHGSHGDSSGFESGAGLSIPQVLLSSPDGDPDEDTFLRHSLLVAGKSWATNKSRGVIYISTGKAAVYRN